MPEKGSYYRSDTSPSRGRSALRARRGRMEFVGKPAEYGTRVRENYIRNDYHKPSDRVRPDWDMSGAVEDSSSTSGSATSSPRAAWPEWKRRRVEAPPRRDDARLALTPDPREARVDLPVLLSPSASLSLWKAPMKAGGSLVVLLSLRLLLRLLLRLDAAGARA